MFLIESYFDGALWYIGEDSCLDSHMKGSWFDPWTLFLSLDLGQGVWPTSVPLDLGVVNRNLAILG